MTPDAPPPGFGTRADGMAGDDEQPTAEYPRGVPACTPPPGATIGYYRRHGAEPALAGYVIGHHLERGLPRLVSVVVERLAVLTLENLHRASLDAQPARIRALGDDLHRLADTLEHREAA